MMDSAEFVQVFLFCGMMNAPVSAHISELLHTLIRVASFDVTWTFLDQYSIPQVSNTTLGPNEVSYSIVELGYSPHLLP